MTTEAGRQYVLGKLKAARNITELAAVWGTIADGYRREPEIFQLKENLKKQMEAKK